MAKILIVDDEYANRLLVTTLLRHAGHTMFEASEGTQALQIAIEHQPDLILVDLALPGMSGTDVVRAVRGHAKMADIAIALYSGTPLYPALHDFMEAYGIRHIIPKPAEPELLLSAVEAALIH